MSAGISVAQTQACLRAALADEVIAIGGIEVAAQECGVSDDTVRRRLAGTHGWTDHDISAMIAAGHARLGRSLPLQRLVTLLADGPTPRGDSRRAVTDTAAILPELLTLAQAMSAAIANNEIDRTEARVMVAAIPEAIRQLEREHTNLVALLRDGGLS